VERSFWLERWQAGQTGFHLDRVNPRLVEHWPRVCAGAPAPGRVLVPLCGKSLDLGWLRARGHQVVGVELSELACAAFFTENELPFERHAAARGLRFVGVGEARGVELLCADIFTLTSADVGAIDLLYDRASLIAMPSGMRERLAAQLAALTSAGTRGLVITLDYPPAERAGPPFAIPPAELRALLDASFVVEPLGSVDLLARDGEDRWQLSALHEHAFLVERRARGA
jgi:thiopurine S-methyltransferase